MCEYEYDAMRDDAKNDIYKLDANGFLPLAFPTSSAVTIPMTFLFLRCPLAPNALPISTPIVNIAILERQGLYLPRGMDPPCSIWTANLTTRVPFSEP